MDGARNNCKCRRSPRGRRRYGSKENIQTNDSADVPRYRACKRVLVVTGECIGGWWCGGALGMKKVRATCA
eukprot:356351-Chlamydomonas_euryale.AAC.2